MRQSLSPTGAFIEAVPFDRHVLGRAKIGRVKITWNSDGNAILSNLLSGEAHIGLDSAIGLSEGQVLKGWPVSTFLRGKIVARDGAILGRPGDGRYLAR